MEGLTVPLLAKLAYSGLGTFLDTTTPTLMGGAGIPKVLNPPKMLSYQT